MSKLRRYRYGATIFKILDDGNLIAEVDLGFYMSYLVELRLCGISFGPGPSDIALDHMRDIMEGSACEIQTYHSRGRIWLATVYLGNLCVNPHLMDNGYALPFKKPQLDVIDDLVVQ